MPQSEQEKVPAQGMTTLESCLVGSFAGMVEVGTTGQILWRLKTRAQQGIPLTLRHGLLQELRQGVFLNMLSMVPITGIQVGMNQVFLRSMVNGHPSDGEKMLCATVAGFSAAWIPCMSEMVMTHMDDNHKDMRDSRRMVAAFRKIVQGHGYRALCIGMAGTAARDAMFSGAYLAAMPRLKSKFSTYGYHELATSFASGVVVGTIATLMSHPFDMVKTYQQLEYVGIPEATRAIYAKGGVPGFFKGAGWRGARVIAAITTIGTLTQKAEECLLRR